MRLEDAIYKLNPTVISIADGVAFDKDGKSVPYDRTQAENLVLATKYQHDRANEYPSLAEQLDMQYWDSVNGTTVWQDTIQAIKAKYPKGV